VANTVDPLAGSYYVESLTATLERDALALLDKVDALGGAVPAIRAGFFQDEIARSAYEHQLRVENGQTPIVGVNVFTDNSEPPVIPAPNYGALEAEQVARLRAVRAGRDNAAVRAALGALAVGAADPSAASLMRLIIDAVRARASVGEISDQLQAVWGRFRPE
jgi:methylmalonyl-CoA mutase, N-terminal domain